MILIQHGTHITHHTHHPSPPQTLTNHAQAIPVRSLPLQHDADKLHLAFALWAEGYAATVRAGAGGKKKAGGKGARGGGGGEQQQPRAKKAKK